MNLQTCSLPCSFLSTATSILSTCFGCLADSSFNATWKRKEFKHTAFSFLGLSTNLFLCDEVYPLVYLPEAAPSDLLGDLPSLLDDVPALQEVLGGWCLAGGHPQSVV